MANKFTGVRVQAPYFYVDPCSKECAASNEHGVCNKQVYKATCWGSKETMMKLHSYDMLKPIKFEHKEYHE